MMRLLSLLFIVFLVACAVQPKTPAEEQSFSSYIDLALLYLSQENAEGAHNALEQAEQIDDSDARLSHAYGMLYQLTGANEEAESFFKQALVVEPNFSQARNNYGVFLSRINRNAEAIIELRKAASDPKYEMRSVAYENLAEVAIKMNNLHLAVESIKSAIAQSPNQNRYYLRAAHLLYLYEDYQGGMDYFNVFLQSVDNSGKEPTSEQIQIGYALASALKDEATKNYLQNRLNLLGPKIQNAN